MSIERHFVGLPDFNYQDGLQSIIQFILAKQSSRIQLLVFSSCKVRQQNKTSLCIKSIHITIVLGRTTSFRICCFLNL